MESDENTIHSLDNITDGINLYLSIIILIFGVVGNILNILVLSQRIFRSNPCAFFFLSTSIVDLISMIFGLPTRIMSSWHRDPTDTNDWICKLRVFMVFTSRTMAIWLIMLASIDRWLLSCRNLHFRKLSHLKLARLGLLLSFIVSIFSYIHMIYCYKANLHNAPLKCYGKDLKCQIITDLVYALITILLPSIAMIIFSIMIISNIHHLRGRIVNLPIITMINPSARRRIKIKRTDYQLLRMLLVQVLLLIIFCIPQVIHKFYITFKSPSSKYSWQDALNNFLYNIDVLLAFIANGMPFYLYTLTGGTVFRQAFYHLLQTIRRKLFCQS